MKRQSPMPPGPAKKAREESAHGPSIDPDQLSDALMSAGVDLREEENLLSSSVHTQPPMYGSIGGGGNGKGGDPPQLLLDPGNLSRAIERAAAVEGLRYNVGDRQELIGLVSAATAECIADIVTLAALVSRHRRMSKNEVPSSVSRALRTLAQQDKEAEQRRETVKLSLGLNSKSDAKGGDSEEIQHRASNDTARMMTSSGKKYSWMNDGGSSGPRAPVAPRARAGDVARVKEVREEPGLALRDVLVALEQKHTGTSRSLIKGYSHVRD